MPALRSMCPASGTQEFDAVLSRFGYYSTVGRCRSCNRLVCLTLSAKLYRHNMVGRLSSWPKWLPGLERTSP